MSNSKGLPVWGAGSVEVGPPALPGESRIRRLAKTADRLISQPLDSIHTVYDILEYAARTHGNRNVFGYRDVEKMVEEEKVVKKVVGGKEVSETKVWKYFQLSGYRYVSFLELRGVVGEVARGLIELGVGRGEVLNIYAQTRSVSFFDFFSFSFFSFCFFHGSVRHARL